MEQAGSQYSYSWVIGSEGVTPYTVEATDALGNQSTLPGSFAARLGGVEACTWRGCRSGAASFSIDDGNPACRDQLEAAGIRGTFYYNGNSQQGWFATYSSAGHEIGSHTAWHICLTPACSPNCTPETLAALPYSQSEVDDYRHEQLDPNIFAIESATGRPVLSLAWPCGCSDPARWEAATSYFLGARGYYDSIANLYWVQDVVEPTPTNSMNLNSVASYDQEFVDRAIAEGKWAIIVSHGSCAGIDYMASRSDALWVAPVGEVLKYIVVRDSSQFSNYSRAGGAISFNALHGLPVFMRHTLVGYPLLPIEFDNQVTVGVDLFHSDQVLAVLVDGTPVEFAVSNQDGIRRLTFDASLEVPRHIVIDLE
jgi:hypothetical protein